METFSIVNVIVNNDRSCLYRLIYCATLYINIEERKWLFCLYFIWLEIVYFQGSISVKNILKPTPINKPNIITSSSTKRIIKMLLPLT